jgi:hypothetical protein
MLAPLLGIARDKNLWICLIGTICYGTLTSRARLSGIMPAAGFPSDRCRPEGRSSWLSTALAMSTNRRRPIEAALLQTPGAEPKAATIPEQQFQMIALRIAEQEHMPAQRLHLQMVAQRPVKTCETRAPVDSSCPPGRSAWPVLSRTYSTARQHAQQLLQSLGIERTPDFDPPPARQRHR